MLAGAPFTSVINALLIIMDSLICGIFLGNTAVSVTNLVTPAYNVDKVILSFGISALRDCLCSVPVAVIGGMIIGIEGIFGGTAAGFGIPGVAKMEKL